MRHPWVDRFSDVRVESYSLSMRSDLHSTKHPGLARLHFSVHSSSRQKSKGNYFGRRYSIGPDGAGLKLTDVVTANVEVALWLLDVANAVSLRLETRLAHRTMLWSARRFPEGLVLSLSVRE